jgi:hypothetical protein
MQNNLKDRERGRAEFFRGVEPDATKHSREWYEGWCAAQNAHHEAAMQIFGK